MKTLLDEVLLLALAALGDESAQGELGPWGASLRSDAIREMKRLREHFKNLNTTPLGFTPEPWRLGNASGTIVANHPIVGGLQGSNDTDYYGGFLIAESVSHSNAIRIVVCVNACAGLSEADIVEAVRQWKSFKRNIVL